MPAALPVPDAPVVSVTEAIARMEAIEAALPAADGLACFNRMYLDVTRQVNSQLGQGFFADPAFMTQLDVTFANLYFAAADVAGDPAAVPLAWRPLAERRALPGIEPIQFALAGMNAHINHDLALAVLQTNADLNIVPAADGPEHADYFAVNTLLDEVSPAAIAMLAEDPLGELAEDTGKVGRLLAAFDIRAARAVAWDFACQLRDLPSVARDAALAAQDVTTGAVGRTLLTAV